MRTTVTGIFVILLVSFYGSSFFSLWKLIDFEKESLFKAVVDTCGAICVVLSAFLLTLLGFSLILYGILDIISFIEKKSLKLCSNSSIQDLYKDLFNNKNISLIKAPDIKIYCPCFCMRILEKYSVRSGTNKKYFVCDPVLMDGENFQITKDITGKIVIDTCDQCKYQFYDFIYLLVEMKTGDGSLS